MDAVRQDVIAGADTVVVKVGTNVLADENGLLQRERMQGLTDQIRRLRESGRRIVLVSSGAIGAGVGRLGLSKRPTDLAQLQACAAVGQSALMQMYQECLAPHGTQAAQILLTAADFENRVRYLNVRNTLLTLFEFNALPIINENDTVSVAEIRFGDNDALAAMVTNLLRAPLLVLLTNVAGLYTADPRSDPSAKLVSVVPKIDRSVTELAQASKSLLGTGGMRSKLRAARMVTAAGEAVIMADGARPNVLDEIFRVEEVGTLFLPHGESISARARWLAIARPKGELVIDEGAVRALTEQGKSLLPIGVIGVGGEFGKGDVVLLRSSAGREVGRGLVNYSAADTRKLLGLRTEQIHNIFGRRVYEELIHRNNLSIIR